jgi:hypothetical protein
LMKLKLKIVRKDAMQKKLFVTLIISLLLLLVGCATQVHTQVSSISHQQISSGRSFYVAPGNDSIESKKIVRMIREQLQKRAYRKTELENADIVVSFSAEMLGAKTKTGTTSTPVNTQVYNPTTGLTTTQTTGYNTQSYTTTTHQREIRIQFHDGEKLRAKEKETLLWEAVGKSGGSSADIIYVAPAIIASIFEELGKDANSKLYMKDTVQKY